MYAVARLLCKLPANCKKLWPTFLKNRGTIFVSIREGIEKQIRLLVVDDTFRYESFMLPIDNLVFSLTKYFEEDVELFKSESIQLCLVT